MSGPGPVPRLSPPPRTRARGGGRGPATGVVGEEPEDMLEEEVVPPAPEEVEEAVAEGNPPGSLPMEVPQRR